MTDIIELERIRMLWSRETFQEATAYSSLQKLKEEIEEVEIHLAFPSIDPEGMKEEYADCLMCLFDSAGRVGIPPIQLFEAFKKKLKKNMERKWKKNLDNTYSHIKE